MQVSGLRSSAAVPEGNGFLGLFETDALHDKAQLSLGPSRGPRRGAEHDCGGLLGNTLILVGQGA